MNDQAPHRARSLEEFRQIQSRFVLAEELAASVEGFRPRSADIIISPSGKCGTTWLQQTCGIL